MEGVEGATCKTECGEHDDVMVGCHGNDATGGNGCHDSRQIGVDGREVSWFLLITDPAA